MTNSTDCQIKSHPWIELAAATRPSGMLRNRFVRVVDKEQIDEWRRAHGNTDVYASICRFAEPQRKPPAVCPCFFDIDADGNLELARADTLRLMEALCKRMAVEPDAVELHFSGAKGFHVIVPLTVFDAAGRPGLMPIWRSLARRLQREGLSRLDLGVYQESRVLRLPNSVNGKSGLHKVPLEFKELQDLGISYVLDLAKSPREYDSMAVPSESPKAAGWLAGAEAWLKTQRQRQVRHPVVAGKGWRTPPCIRRVETSALPDGVRHCVYRALARFYATTGMAPQEAVERLREIDQRNPIRDPDYMERVVHYAWNEGGFDGCASDALGAYCDRSRCFLVRQQNDGNCRSG